MTLTQIFLYSLAGLAVLVAATLILLPRDVTVTRSGMVAAPPESILSLAASGRGYQRFNPYLSADPDLAIALFGPDSGVGSGFRFDGKDGRGHQVVAALNDTGVRYDIDLGPMGRPRQTITAVPEGDRSRVTWRMQADLGLNPIARVMGLFMDRMVGPTFERGLRNLSTVFAQG